MKDNIFLLITGIIFAILAWSFLYVAGEWVFLIGLASIFILFILNTKRSKFGDKKDKTQ